MEKLAEVFKTLFETIVNLVQNMMKGITDLVDNVG